MRILIIKNRFKKKLDWKRGIQHLKDNTPLQYEIDEIKTDFDFTFRTVGNATYKGSVVGGDYYEKLRSVVPEGKYDAVCLVYGNKAPGIRASISEHTPLYPDTDVIQVIKEDDGGKAFNHEMFHVFFHKLERKGIILPDPMDTYRNNQSLTSKDSNRTDALKLLAPYWKTLEDKSFFSKVMNAIKPKATYLYFTEQEVIGLNPKLVEMLDNARGIAGVPFKITSGYRTTQHNKEVGGVKDSSHTTGLAVDLLVKDSVSGGKILLGLVQAGFKRFGFYQDGHIHVDIDETKPTPCYWIK